MKRIIRPSTFETNSSSTHSLIILSKEKFKKWEDGEILLIPYSYDKFIEKDKLEEYMKSKKGWGHTPQTFDEYSDELYESNLECDVENYTTEGGEEIVIVAEYGENR